MIVPKCMLVFKEMGTVLIQWVICLWMYLKNINPMLLSFTSKDTVLFIRLPWQFVCKRAVKFNLSYKLKAEYDRLKATKEKEDKDAEDKAAREKRIAECEAKEKEEKERKTVFGGCLGVVVLVTLLLLAYFKDGNMVAATVVGVVALTLSIIFKSFASHLLFGLIFGLIFTVDIGNNHKCNNLVC